MLPLNRLLSSKLLLTGYLCFLGQSLYLPDFTGYVQEPALTPPSTITFAATALEPHTESATATRDRSLFEQNLPRNLPLPGVDNWVEHRILREHGAIFVAQGNVIHPPTIIFANAAYCANWQAQVPTQRIKLGSIPVELQTEAMEALLAARREAAAKNLRITPRGTWAARRSYQDTEKIWSRRVVPGLAFWQRRGKLSDREAARIRVLTPARQVQEILRLEAQGLFFSKDFSKSVLCSGAAPGASQHLSMLALDINEYNQEAVRVILARHGWFQTVVSDLPHFTYLGTSQAKLPELGLRKTMKNKRVYWTPA